jgi:ACS family glucarate transporter-like MFS transporter
MAKGAAVRSAHGYWPVIWLMCAVSAVSYLERTNVSIVGPLMRRDLGLDEAQLGNVYSAFLFAYAVCQFPAGFLADRLGPRRVLSAALVGWGVFNVLTALVQPLGAWLGVFYTLLGIRFLLGVAQAPTFPGAARSLLSWVPATQRGLANAIVIAGIGLGSAVAPIFFGSLAEAWDWPRSLLIGSIPAFLLAPLVYWLAREHPPLGDTAAAIKEPSTRLGPRQASDILHVSLRLLTKANLWVLTLSYLLQGYVSYVFVFWFFHYLKEVRQFSMLESSWLAAMPWLLTLVTTPLGGLISDGLVVRLGYPWGRRLLPMVGLVLAGGLLLWGAHAEHPYVAVALLVICQGLVMSVEGPFWATMIEVAGEDAGAAGGLLNMGGNIGGTLSVSITPLIAMQFGWDAAFGVAAGLSAVGGLLWLGITRTAKATGE